MRRKETKLEEINTNASQLMMGLSPDKPVVNSKIPKVENAFTSLKLLNIIAWSSLLKMCSEHIAYCWEKLSNKAYCIIKF